MDWSPNAPGLLKRMGLANSITPPILPSNLDEILVHTKNPYPPRELRPEVPGVDSDKHKVGTAPTVTNYIFKLGSPSFNHSSTTNGSVSLLAGTTHDWIEGEKFLDNNCSHVFHGRTDNCSNYGLFNVFPLISKVGYHEEVYH